MPSLFDLQLNRQLYKTQPQTLETQSADTIASNLSPTPSNAIASGNAVTDINTNSETINGSQLTPGTIPQPTLDIANWGWTQTCTFSKTDADTVSWTSGTFSSADGTQTYSISSGNTGNMVALTYVYLDIAVSTSAYQLTTNVNTPVGVGKVLIAVCQNGSTDATYNLVQAHQIVGDNIIANTINATKITAGSITATQINSGYIYAGAIDATQINAGTLTGIVIQTQSTGQRVVLQSTLAQFFNSSGTEIVETYASSNSYIIKGMQSNSAILLDCGSTGAISFVANGSLKMLYDPVNNAFYPITSNSIDLGASGLNWKDFWIAGQFEYRTITQPIVYHGFCSGTSITDKNNSFTLLNPSTGRYTVTHNLNTTSYQVQVSAFNSVTRAITVDGLGSNTFQVRIATLGVPSTGTDPALINSDFMFTLVKLA